MKILHIRLQNLNSLAGTWHIDFTDPAYSENSLFAITGPTGAGKSTILDGIALALYGRTPRLGKVTKSSNEIMSRHCGICFAEVEFQTVKGHFRCHWSQHRARQKSGGELQPPRHEIADAASGTILESRIVQVAARVEAVTGMDFDRFTRSTLLAQGGFAAFLEASEDDKAPILEQITGTAIYSDISIKVHEIHSRERLKLEQQNSDLSRMELLTPEEEEKLDKEQRQRETQSQTLQKELNLQRKQLSILRDFFQLETNLKDYDRQLLEIKEEEHHHSLDFVKIPQGLAAAKIAPLYLEQQRLLLRRDHLLLESRDIANRQATLNKQKLKMRTQLTLAVANLEDQQNAREKGLRLITTVRNLDQRMEGIAEQLRQTRDQLKTLEKQEKDDRKSLQTLSKEEGQIDRELLTLESFFQGHMVDERLVEELGEIRMGIKALCSLAAKLQEVEKSRTNAQQASKSRRNEMKTSSLALKKAEGELAANSIHVKELAAVRKQILDGREAGKLAEELSQIRSRIREIQTLLLHLADYEQTRQRHNTLRKELSRTSESLRTLENEQLHSRSTLAAKTAEVDLLEKNHTLQIRIQTLEDDRKQLQEGSPCPLCGATDHPYGPEKTVDLSLENSKLEETKRQLQKMTTEEKELTRRQTVAETKLKALSAQLKEAETDLKQSAEKGNKLLSAFDFPALAELDHKLISSAEKSLLAQQQKLEQDLSNLAANDRESGVAEKNKQELSDKKQQLEKTLLTAEHRVSSAIEKEEQLLGEENTLRDQLHSDTNTISSKLAEYDLLPLDPEKATEVEKNLQERANKWKENKARQLQLSAQLLQLTAAIKHRTGLSEKGAQQITTLNQQVTLQKKSMTDLLQERDALFGTRNTEKEGQLLEQAVKVSQDNHVKIQQRQKEIDQQHTAFLTLAQRLKAEEKELEQPLTEAENYFNRALEDSSFSDLQDFLQARMDPALLDKIQEQLTALHKRKDSLHTLIKDKEAALNKRKTELGEEREIKALEHALQQQEKELEQLQEQIGAAREQLEQNKKLQSRSAAQLKLIKKQKQRVSRWDRLHQLIGSADGKKFRNFAQGLTFEMMVSHANHHLATMSDRYILVRAKERPLELNVIDTWQAGEIRSTRNLSGGESFLVSLALALGLSRMASNNVRVDSLFLDEGFGTLDEETLEAALEALGSLKEENKLIGIISHVTALKQRIPLQIEIVPESGGRSTIRGPGVAKGSE